MYKEIDWNTLQKVYDDEKVSTRELANMFDIPVVRIWRATKRGEFKTRDKEEIERIKSNKATGKTHSEETKEKIKNARLQYLKENPDKVPYLLNHSRNQSYPEKYFYDIFIDRIPNIKKYHQVGIYEIDFAIIDKRIAIEIDGEQHYTDRKIVNSDIRKNNFLDELGWDIIRIRWRDYQKMSSDSKIKYINTLIDYIDNLTNDKPVFKIEDRNKYCSCGNIITRKAKECKSCHRKGRRLVDRPSKDTLEIDIKELGYKGTGDKYGVSDNSIRKWLKSFNGYNNISL